LKRDRAILFKSQKKNLKKLSHIDLNRLMFAKRCDIDKKWWTAKDNSNVKGIKWIYKGWIFIAKIKGRKNI